MERAELARQRDEAKKMFGWFAGKMLKLAEENPKDDTAADDDGAGKKLGAVALFNAGVEGVAVDVGDGQRGEFGVADDAAVAAGRADGGVAGVGEAGAARGG